MSRSQRRHSKAEYLSSTKTKANYKVIIVLGVLGALFFVLTALVK